MSFELSCPMKGFVIKRIDINMSSVRIELFYEDRLIKKEYVKLEFL